MTRQAWFRVFVVMIWMSAGAGAGWAVDAMEGALRLDLPPQVSGGGPGRPRAVDLQPRLIGQPFFHWDGIPEAGLGFPATFQRAEFVEAYQVDGFVTRVLVCFFNTGATGTVQVMATVYNDNGPGGGPGTMLAQSAATRIPSPVQPSVDCSDITVPAVERHSKTFVGVAWMPNVDSNNFVVTDNSGTTPIQEMYGRAGTAASPGTFGLVRNTQPQVRAFGIGVHVVSNAQAFAPCFNTDTVICLNGDRFRFELDFRRNNDNEGLGRFSGLRTDDSAVLWFFDAQNLEMLVKVLDRCVGATPRYWVFFAATTNVELHMTVTDTFAGKVKTYFNPLNTAAPPVQDVDAFATCP
jgi:hypothetical protein